MAMEKGKVCVTGGGGFVASWVVKLLLSKDYTVHGTLREPMDQKHSHLSKLENASENLKLFEADLLDYGSLVSAINGCSGVLHVASPVPSTTVPNPEVDVLEPAVRGTLNVLKACIEAKVKRVVFVSSAAAAVVMNPAWPKDRLMDETCWSDKEYCRSTKHWYRLSKTEAESEALDFAKRIGLDLVTISPTTVWGPILQSTINASSLSLIKILRDGGESKGNRAWHIADTRDLAAAVLMAYEKPEAEGRYICVAHKILEQDLVEKLKGIYPNYNYPKTYTEAENKETMTSEKLQSLGWTYRSLEETLVDSVESYRKAGNLD